MNDNMLRALFDASPLGIAHLEINPVGLNKSADLRFAEVNPAFEKISGLGNKNISGKGVRQVFQGTGTAIAGWLSLFERIARDGGSAEFEHFLEGTGCWFKVYAYPTDVGHIAVVLTELSSSNHSEDAYSIKELQQKAFWDNNLFGILIADRNGRYIDANDEAC